MLRIDIIWEGPLTADTAHNLHSSDDYGIYQIYGDHPVYGSETLLYIGRSRGQKFGVRIKEHDVEPWLGSSSQFYVGRLCGETQVKNKEWNHRIDVAEKILIYVHAPSWNSSNIQGFNVNEDTHIFNWRDRGLLLPEVSEKRWEILNNNLPSNYSTYKE